MLKFEKEKKKEREGRTNLGKREGRYYEKLRNGTPEEQKRERVFQRVKKRNGGWVNMGVGRPL